MRRLWRAMGAAVPLVALACGVDEAEGARGGSARDFPALSSTRTLAPEPTPSADAAADAAAYAAADPAPDTATYEGDGFSFRYPSDATIGTLTHEAVQVAEQTHQLLTAIELRGPALRDDEGNPIAGSASYVLEVATYGDSAGLGLDRWVASNGDREHDDEAESEGRDPGVAPLARATVAGLPALRQSLFGGDCELVRYYVARGGRVVVFRYADFPVQNDPLNPQNVRTYQAVMKTFRWSAR